MSKNNNWSKAQVDLNVLDLLKADNAPASSPDGNSVMIYSIPGTLTANEVSIQGQGALTAADIARVNSSFPSWNDLNVGSVPTTHQNQPWQNVPQGATYNLKQAISSAASAVPKVALRLTEVQTIWDEYIRVFSSKLDSVTPSNIDVKIGTWATSRLLKGTLTTFWATPPQSPADPIFQTGGFHTQGQAIDQWIKFDVPYKTRPKAFIGLTGIDLNVTYDLDATVVSAKREGFYVNITSPGTTLHAANIFWVAWPGNLPGVETGTFYTRPAKGGSVEGKVQFDTVFDREPKAHFALSNFNFIKPNAEFQIYLTAKTTNTALEWSAGSWLPTGRIRGNYFVFKVWRKARFFRPRKACLKRNFSFAMVRMEMEQQRRWRGGREREQQWVFHIFFLPFCLFIYLFLFFCFLAVDIDLY